MKTYYVVTSASGEFYESGETGEYKGSSRNRYYRYDYYICPNGHIIEVFKG